MRIGEFADRTGSTTKTIRYDESIDPRAAAHTGLGPRTVSYMS